MKARPRIGATLAPVQGRVAHALRPQVTRGQFEQFPRVDDLGGFPEPGEVALVAGYKVIRPSLLRALQEDVVIRVRRHLDPPRGRDMHGATFEQIEDLAKAKVRELELGPMKHSLAFFENVG